MGRSTASPPAIAAAKTHQQPRDQHRQPPQLDVPLHPSQELRRISNAQAPTMLPGYPAVAPNSRRHSAPGAGSPAQNQDADQQAIIAPPSIEPTSSLGAAGRLETARPAGLSWRAQRGSLASR